MRKKKRGSRPLETDTDSSASTLRVRLDHEASSLPPTRTGLAAASVFEQPVNVDKFRTALENKLKRLPYPYPQEGPKVRRTFWEWLSARGAIEAVLEAETLSQIIAGLQLVKVVEVDERLEKERLSGHKLPLKFHRAVIRELKCHGKRIDALQRKYRVPEEWFSQYDFDIGKQEIKETMAIAATKWPGSAKKDIMGTGWSTDLEASLRVYQILANRLAGIQVSDRCLRILAVIIASPHDRPRVTPEALQRALARRKK
jgi:hypothetical protein